MQFAQCHNSGKSGGLLISLLLFLLPLTVPGSRSSLSASEAGFTQIHPSIHSQIISEQLPTIRHSAWHWGYRVKRKQACFVLQQSLQSSEDSNINQEHSRNIELQPGHMLWKRCMWHCKWGSDLVREGVHEVVTLELRLARQTGERIVCYRAVMLGLWGGRGTGD